jgi:hypothetical protein
MQGGRPDPGDATESLVNLLAERIVTVTAEKLTPLIAGEIDRALGEKVENFPEDSSGTTREVMHSRDAADVLAMSHAAFNKLAPSLPRHRLSPGRYVYLREDLLEWLRSR